VAKGNTADIGFEKQIWEGELEEKATCAKFA
jgi:hypothetical protein